MKTLLTTDIEAIIRLYALKPNNTGDVTIGEANRALVYAVIGVLDRLDIQSTVFDLVYNYKLKKELNIRI
jgi:hypothetical protein